MVVDALKYFQGQVGCLSRLLPTEFGTSHSLDTTLMHLSSTRVEFGLFLENVVGLFCVGGTRQIGRCGDDVILKLFLLITRRPKQLLQKHKNLHNRHGACVTKYDRFSLISELSWIS